MCQVCHRFTKYYKKGVVESGHPTSNCFNCHFHDAKGGAFKASGTCDSCHGYPPIPRNVAVTFGTTGNFINGAFEDYSGGGGAHIVGKHVPATVTAADGWSTVCLTCHNGGDSSSFHKRVIPIRSNVPNVSVKLNPSKRLNIGIQFSYTGAKLVNPPANKTGSCYNANCHFTKSPKWSTTK
jgi:hypothetical protein